MSDLLEKTFYACNGREKLIIFNKSFGQFVSYYFDDELIAQNEIPIQLSFNALTQKKSFYELVVALNIWDLNPFSPIPAVPNTGAGETPNNTPAHNPNGVPLPKDTDFVDLPSDEYKSFVNQKIDDFFWGGSTGDYSPLVNLFDHDEIATLELVFRHYVSSVSDKRFFSRLSKDEQADLNKVRDFVNYHNLDVAL